MPALWCNGWLIGAKQCKSVLQSLTINPRITGDNCLVTIAINTMPYHTLLCAHVFNGPEFQASAIPKNAVAITTKFCQKENLPLQQAWPTSPGDGNLPSCCTLSLFRTRSSFTKSGRIAKFCDTWLLCFRIQWDLITQIYLEYRCLDTFSCTTYIHVHARTCIHTNVSTLSTSIYIYIYVLSTSVQMCLCIYMGAYKSVHMNLVDTNLWCVYASGQHICIST